MYADGEVEYLARPGDYAEAVQARRRLSAAAEALEAQVSTLLRIGPLAASHAIEVAVGFVERIPKVFALIGEGVISPKSGEVALSRSRVLTAEQIGSSTGASLNGWRSSTSCFRSRRCGSSLT